MDSSLELEAALRERLRINLRVLRLSAGLSVKEAAARASIHWRRWQKIEAGTVNVGLATLERIAAAIGVAPEALLQDCSHLLN